MNPKDRINHLYDKDTSIAYKALQELEAYSRESDELYPFLDEFVSMCGDEKYVIRCRGFRLFCQQARWDKDKRIDARLDEALTILQDDKPTAVRQALAALLDLVPYKPECHELIRTKLAEIDIFRYKDTMHRLLDQDIAAVLDAMEN